MATEKYKALMSEYRTLAKRADERLRKLEIGAKNEQKYANVLKYAYSNAMDDIRRFSGADAKRFNVKPPNDTQRLQAKINAMRRFLESPTSTTTGIKRIYEKRVNTINEKYGTNFTWEGLKEYFDSELSKKLDKKYDSGSSLINIGNIQKHEEEIKTALQEHKPIHIKLDDPIEEYEINQIIRYNKKDLKKFLEV